MLIMDLLWMMLLLVLVCSEAQKVTEVRGELGQDVTLTCSIRNKDIYWFMQIHSQFRAGIGRTFSSDASYFSPDFKTKYLILENRLVVKNISAEDCRLYFCAEKINGTFVFVDTFGLTADVPVTLSDYPDVPVTPSSDSNHQNPSCSPSQSEHVVLSSFILKAVLFSVFSGLMCSYLMRRRGSSRGNQPPGFTCEDPEMMDSPQVHSSCSCRHVTDTESSETTQRVPS
ncbi:uncharacterized protein [Leuresthes tenuis]|uniref:uncharacterized protein n=1 Tax=Leuresthes tenuis TaxID=355514 RepID=UPI003B50A2A1